jgi:hypothetical protein
LSASPPAVPPFVGTGTVTLATDPGIGTFALNTLGTFSMSFVFGTNTYSATDSSNSEITTPLSQVLLVITSVSGVEHMVFSNTQPLGSGNNEGSLDFDPPGLFLSFSPPMVGLGLYVEGTSSASGIVPQFKGTYTGTETPLPAALPLFATGLGALGLLGWRRKRRAARW